MFINFRERKREKIINVREKHQLVTSCMHPYQGLNLLLRYVPGIECEALRCPE